MYHRLSLVLPLLTAATVGVLGCVGSPDHCHGCLSALADGGVPPPRDGAVGNGGGTSNGGASGFGGMLATTGGSSGGGDTGNGGAGTAGGGTAGEPGSGGGTAGRGGAAAAGGTAGQGAGGGVGGNPVGGRGGNASLGGMAGGGRGGGGGQAGGAGAGVGGAGPRILSIDFVGPTAAMAATETAGVKSVANWNAARGRAGSATALVMSDGTATGASVAWNAPGAGQPGIFSVGLMDSPGNARMMNGYLDPTDPTMPATIMVNALPMSLTTGGFDVYVYVLANVPAATRTYRYQVGSAPATMVSQTGPSPTTFTNFVLAPNNGAGNYVVFRNVAGSSFTLTATPGSGARAPVNGIQIVSPSGS